MFKHMVTYVGRSSVFTDSRFTDKVRATLHTHEEHGWELVSTAPRSGPLGDVSGIWLFFKRPAEMEDQPAPTEEAEPSSQTQAA
jgi:hypothetical protein